ncbi:MAG: Lcl C-terminal domain-containing protein [Thermoleophilia bacterium]
MDINGFLQTGQAYCHDADGRKIDCAGSGQDAEFSRGLAWSAPRFEVTHKSDANGTVTDMLTGLVWTRDANPGEFPMDWAEAHEFVSRMNQNQEHGFEDWRLPDRRELRSLISHQTRNPALPEGHPFINVFPGWYWSTTTAAINDAFAWYVHMEGGRTFYGAKNQYYLVWPVRGEGNGVLPATGQANDSPFGAVWPEPRFEVEPGGGDEAGGGGGENDGDAVRDRLTGLIWQRAADLAGEPASWEEALGAVRKLNLEDAGLSADAERSGAKEPRRDTARWRLPNINELESLVDLSRHDPALPAGHPFTDYRDVYWSSTTSMFEPDWAWALYMNKGAVGVGRKGYARFHVWAVRDPMG